MKTKPIFLILFFTATVFALINCGGNKKEATESHEHEGHEHDSTEHASGSTATTEASEPQFQVDAAFQQQLSEVFTSYVLLKDAFVSSDANKVKTEASVVKQSLGKADMKLLSGAAHNDWMNYLGGMETSLKEMEASTDIEVQRQSFSSLSENLYKSIKAYGLGGATAYYEFCPMAFDNQGAFWLSIEEKIRNPYFGDKMLTCGQVKEKLK
jgi:hypothetical protein